MLERVVTRAFSTPHPRFGRGPATRPRPTLCLAAGLSTFLPVGLPFGRAWAADPPQTVDLSLDIDVIAHRLDLARQQIQRSLGASVYGFSPDALQTIPLGDNTPLNQVLLQAPGVGRTVSGKSICVASMPTCNIA